MVNIHLKDTRHFQVLHEKKKKKKKKSEIGLKFFFFFWKSTTKQLLDKWDRYFQGRVAASADSSIV